MNREQILKATIQTDVEFLDYVTKGGRVRRWNSRTIIGIQSNDQHQWSVLGISNFINRELTKEAILYAAFHDSPEWIYGDMNGHWKSECDRSLLDPLLAPAEELLRKNTDISDAQKCNVKMADKLSDLMFLCHQKELGNQTLEDPLSNTIDKIVKRYNDNEYRYNDELCQRIRTFITYFNLDKYNLLERLNETI